MRTNRIHIAGGPGAGKSTLALRLGRQLDVESYKLDDIAYDPISGIEQPLSLRLQHINSIAAKPAWITEGVYLRWTNQLFQSADLIIWLDVPLRVALFRKIPHHLRRSLSGEYPHAGMRNQIDHTLFVWRYYTGLADVRPATPDNDRAVTRAATAQALAPFTAKVVRCQTMHEVDVLTTQLEARTFQAQR